MNAPSGPFHVAPPERRMRSPDQPSLIGRALTWAAAASVTLGVHGGAYLALTRNSAPPPPPPVSLPAAVMIDLVPMVMTSRSEVDNAADGPEADAREAIEEAVEPPPPEPVPDVPPPPPEPVAEVPPPPPPDVKADAVLPPKKPENVIEKPVERPPEKVVETPPEQPKVAGIRPKLRPRIEKPTKTPKKVVKKQPAQTAQKAGGGPRSDQQTGNRSAAQSVGGTSASAQSQRDWIAAARAKVIRAMRYPPSSRRRREEGLVRVSVTFDGSGSVAVARVVASSGFEDIDKEGVAVMRRVRFPAPPDGQATTQIFPLNFSLR